MAVRSRMIVDVTPEVHMAIKLRAVKDGITTGEVVCRAIEQVFPDDIEEAKEVLKEKCNG